MLKTQTIEHNVLTEIVKRYEKAIKKLKEPPFFISSLESFNAYLKGLLQSIDKTDIEEIKTRVDNNKELTKKLLEHGNMEDDLNEAENPKHILLEIANALLNENKKATQLKSIIKNNSKNSIKTVLISNIKEPTILDELDTKEVKMFSVVSYKGFESFMENKNSEKHNIIDISLEGYNDFLKYHYCLYPITLLLYSFEEEVYSNCVERHRQEMEKELMSSFRANFSGLKYEPIEKQKEEKELSNTIQNILEKHDDSITEKEFEAYKLNPALNYPEELIYYVEYEESICESEIIEANDYVFNHHNDLIKIGRVKKGDKIKVYKEFDIVDLFKIMAKEDEETFNCIEEYSKLWKDCLLNFLNENFLTTDQLYQKLKNHGLSVTQVTLENYLNNKVKFPSKKKDLFAIERLTKNEKLSKALPELLKYKRIYNGMMIAMGRNLKEEICLFLQKGQMGEILNKASITRDFLEKFIEYKMPLKTVKRITPQVQND